MRAPRFVVASALCGLGFACAPVQSSTHFQRWDSHSAKVKAEAPPSDEAAPANDATPTPAPPANSPVVYGTGGGATPAITATATASRVIRPGDAPASTDDDDDAIY